MGEPAVSQVNWLTDWVRNQLPINRSPFYIPDGWPLRDPDCRGGADGGYPGARLNGMVYEQRHYSHRWVNESAVASNSLLSKNKSFCQLGRNASTRRADVSWGKGSFVSVKRSAWGRCTQSSSLDQANQHGIGVTWSSGSACGIVTAMPAMQMWCGVLYYPAHATTIFTDTQHRVATGTGCEWVFEDNEEGCPGTWHQATVRCQEGLQCQAVSRGRYQCRLDYLRWILNWMIVQSINQSFDQPSFSIAL